MEGENVGKDFWNLGPLGEWRGNLVQFAHLLEPMRVLLKRTHSDGGYGVSTGHLLSPSKASRGRTELHSTE